MTDDPIFRKKCINLMQPYLRGGGGTSIEQVFQAFYNWDQFESGLMYSSLNLT